MSKRWPPPWRRRRNSGRLSHSVPTQKGMDGDERRFLHLLTRRTLVTGEAGAGSSLRAGLGRSQPHTRGAGEGVATGSQPSPAQSSQTRWERRGRKEGKAKSNKGKRKQRTQPTNSTGGRNDIDQHGLDIRAPPRN